MFTSPFLVVRRPWRLALPALLGALAFAPFAPAQTTRQAEPPSIDALLEKMVEAAGGEKAIRHHTFRTLRGAFELPTFGLSGAMVTHMAAPDRRRVTIEIYTVGSVMGGYGDGVAWRITPPQQGGPELLDGAPAARSRRQADFYSILNYRMNYSSIEVVGTVEFNDQHCYEMKLRAEDGIESTLYVSAETGLIAGTLQEVESTIGTVDLTSTFGDYKSFDGVMIATRTELDFGGQQQQVLTIEKVSFEPIDDAAFALPDPIKALLEEATSQPGD